MEKLILDTGSKEYQINENGILQFSPTDPGLYFRLSQLMNDLESKRQEFEELEVLQGEDDLGRARQMLKAMDEADSFIKERLAYVFGPKNDFDQILGGVSTLAVASNGQWVVTNLINALLPEIQAGAQEYARAQAQAAVKEARERRAQRGADK